MSDSVGQADVLTLTGQTGSGPKSCPACGGPVLPWRRVPASDPALLPAEFRLWRCPDCGSGLTEGMGSSELYETGAYRPGNPRLHDLARPILASFDRSRLAMLRSLVPPPARLLDAGAGRGRFVAAACAAGYEAFGLEPSSRDPGPHGVRIERTSVERAQIEPGSLDAVTLWHVLEHLNDPGLALERIGGWLRPGGALLVGVPNLDSLQARLGGPRWYHLDVPRHRVHFTTRGLHNLLSAKGFYVSRTHHLLLEHNPFGMWQTLLSSFTVHPSYVYNVLKRNAPVRSPDLLITAAALPLIPFAVGLEVLAGMRRQGGTIAVLARRG